jgi:signal recognition particle subunit SRP54
LLCCPAGRGINEVAALVEAYRHYSKYATQAIKAANLPKVGKGGKIPDMPINPRHMQQTLQRMGNALPPQLIKQMGGIGGLQQLMKSMESMGK